MDREEYIEKHLITIGWLKNISTADLEDWMKLLEHEYELRILYTKLDLENSYV